MISDVLIQVPFCRCTVPFFLEGDVVVGVVGTAGVFPSVEPVMMWRQPGLVQAEPPVSPSLLFCFV